MMSVMNIIYARMDVNLFNKIQMVTTGIIMRDVLEINSNALFNVIIMKNVFKNVIKKNV